MDNRMDDDIRQLDLLATFHYVVAGIIALCGCFPIIHLVVGICIVTGSFTNNRSLLGVARSFNHAASLANCSALAWWATA